MSKRVLLGMSGGVDSSVSAILLMEMGYQVLGITFIFSDKEKNNTAVEDAKNLAKILKIKHLVVDLRQEFKEKVIHYFISEYKSGRTPFPCAFCNPNVKFAFLEKYADRYNCDFISTGHYARTSFFNNIKYIYQGLDPEKDQSFFLWGLRKELIKRLIFPLGNYQKSEIRNIARDRGFTRISDKKDSLGICFIEGNDYRKFLKKEGIKSEPGYFVDKNDMILGKHTGILNYTVGQRRGLGLNLNFPVFVAEIELNENKIVLAKYADLYRSFIYIKDLYMVDNQINKSDLGLTVKIRYRLQETPCRLHILDETRARVELLKPEAMIAPGQSAVFYCGERLAGGGFIEMAE